MVKARATKRRVTTHRKKKRVTKKRSFSSLGVKVHNAIRRRCKWCKLTGKGHDEDKHRFHGKCAFKNTHSSTPKSYCRKHKCGCQK